MQTFTQSPIQCAHTHQQQRRGTLHILSEAASHLGSSMSGGVGWDEKPGLQLVLGSYSYLCFSFTDKAGWRQAYLER